MEPTGFAVYVVTREHHHGVLIGVCLSEKEAEAMRLESGDDAIWTKWIVEGDPERVPTITEIK